MITRSIDLTECASMASSELKTLAGILDNSIQESSLMRKERENRKNGILLHALIREGVILATQHMSALTSSPVRVQTRASDGIRIRLRHPDLNGPVPLVARPRTARLAEPTLSDKPEDGEALFPDPVGHIGLFYTVAAGRLGQLTLSRTLTHPDMYYRDCQILEEIRIQPLAQFGHSPNHDTRNDADDLTGLITPGNYSDESSEESTSIDVDTSTGIRRTTDAG